MAKSFFDHPDTQQDRRQLILNKDGRWSSYLQGDDYVTLDGDYTVQELEAIIVHINANMKEVE